MFPQQHASIPPQFSPLERVFNLEAGAQKLALRMDQLVIGNQNGFSRTLGGGAE
jgi:hypothetical protein